MSEEVKTAESAKPKVTSSVKPVYINVSDITLHLTKGIFAPGAPVDATPAELKTLYKFIQRKV